jgi:hypothetical protein
MRRSILLPQIAIRPPQARRPNVPCREKLTSSRYSKSVSNRLFLVLGVDEDFTILDAECLSASDVAERESIVGRTLFADFPHVRHYSGRLKQQTCTVARAGLLADGSSKERI